MTPKGQYLENSSYYLGIMPNGEKRFYASEGDYIEDFEEENRKKCKGKDGEE